MPGERPVGAEELSPHLFAAIAVLAVLLGVVLLVEMFAEQSAAARAEQGPEQAAPERVADQPATDRAGHKAGRAVAALAIITPVRSAIDAVLRRQFAPLALARLIMAGRIPVAVAVPAPGIVIILLRCHGGRDR